MKKTNIISGACFAYYDELFEDCRLCKIRQNCQRASVSASASQIRALAKYRSAVIDNLVAQWSTDTESASCGELPPSEVE